MGGERWDVTAIVLAGGQARRLGQDKARASVAGESMLSRIVRGLPARIPVVVVSPDENVLAVLPGDPAQAPAARQGAGGPAQAPAARQGAGGPARLVSRTCEQPAGGGPVAGLAAGLRDVATSTTLLLAVDMPLGVHAALMALQELTGSSNGDGMPGGDAVVPVDADGNRQPLCAAYRTEALRSALAALEAETGTVRNASMRALLARLEVTDLPDLPEQLLLDVDTPGALAAADSTLRGGEWGSPEPG